MPHLIERKPCETCGAWIDVDTEGREAGHVEPCATPEPTAAEEAEL